MTNWPLIVKDLCDAITRAELARLTGAGASTLSDLGDGSSREPRHALGVTLLALHNKHCGKRSKAA